MSEKLPFPFPCEYSPKFDTWHEAEVFIEEYQAHGHIKRCAHLTTRPVSDGFGATEYSPDCRKDSFIREEGSYGKWKFYGCPRDCRLYEPAWKGKTKKWFREHWWPFRGFVIGTAQWYASLSMPVQTIIALIILALILTMAGSLLSDTIIEGLRIIFGK